MDFQIALDNFKLAGFREFSGTSMLGHENALCLLQKRISDDQGTKYFINVYPYDMMLGNHTHQSFYLDCHFERLGHSLNLSYPVESPEQAESLAEEFWTKFGCDYYEVN